MSSRKRAKRRSSHQLLLASNNVEGELLNRFFLKGKGAPGNSEAFKAAYGFVQMKPMDKRKAARRIIVDAVIDGDSDSMNYVVSLAIAESESLLTGYATLDEPHRADIEKLVQEVTLYLKDGSRKRPLNALMLAAPGAGKSHFIRQLAGAMSKDRVQAVTFNMATMQATDDMARPIDELRNLKVNDRFPLLFLDEFDSDPARYASLLPLLWDGELQVGSRDLKLGKAVIVLAGSNPGLPEAMRQSGNMGLDGPASGDAVPTGKLVDLLSRINGGVIAIPDLELRSRNRDRRVDKVCITVGLLRKRFGTGLSVVPRSLLRFIAHTSFRYSVRSIAHLIDTIDSKACKDGVLKANRLGLPIRTESELASSSLTLHLLDKDQGFGIVNRWREYSRDKAGVRTAPPPLMSMIGVYT